MFLNSLKKKILNKLDLFVQDRIIQSKKAEAETFENWVYKWLYFQNFEYAKTYTPQNTYFEFGTGWGGTLSGFLRACNRLVADFNFDITKINIVLFDSFKGLPEEKDSSDINPIWGKGMFSYSKDYIIDIIKKHNFPLENVTIVEGYFEDSLNKDNFEKIKKLPNPSIITMDVDYYSSTMLALDYIRPLLKSGAVFYFDDLYSFHLHPQMGQVKAINDFNSSGDGRLSPLVHMNYIGRGYIFSGKEWEYSKSD
jgi:O-methyltransferase